MIGYLTGRLLWKAADGLVLLVGGVGYQLECPASTIWALPKTGEQAALFVSMVVREDAIRLFGFVTQIDKMVFETLISVTSVGPKLALALMGPMGGAELVGALHARDERRLLAVPGVGQRKLEKLLVEMGPKLERLWCACQSLGSASGAEDAFSDRPSEPLEQPEEGALLTSGQGSQARAAAAATDGRQQRRELLADLESALTNIGHRDKFIRPCLEWVERQWDAGALVIGLEESLRAVLQRDAARFITSDAAAATDDDSGSLPRPREPASVERPQKRCAATKTWRTKGKGGTDAWSES